MVRGADRQSALFDDNFRAGGNSCTISALPVFFRVLEVRGLARPLTERLGGRVHADKDDVRLGDVAIDVGGKMQVPAVRCPHNFSQPRLVDGQLFGLPGGNLPRLVDVDDGYRVFGALCVTTAIVDPPT